MSAQPHDQRGDALAKANRVRLANAQTYREIRALPAPAAFRRVSGILRAPRGAECAMRVDALLSAASRIGPSKVAALIALAGVRHADRRLRDLTDRQRRVIATALDHPRRVWPYSRLGR